MNLNKRQLRNKALNYLKTISMNDKNRIESKQHSNLVKSALWKRSDTIGLTFSQPLEWDTSELIKIAWKEGKRVVLPKCTPDSRQLHFYIVNSFDELENVYKGLLEPMEDVEKEVFKNDIDLLVVPGLLFDNSGYRIGFGGGYYDRYLVDYQNTTLSICSSKQLIKEVPRGPYDLSVDYLITEKGLHQTEKT